jgi:hypothetical protein
MRSRLERVGGPLVVALALAPFVWLALMMNSADAPSTFQARLGAALFMVVLGAPWVIAARLLWRAWWRRAGAGLAGQDGPARLLAAASATLPADRRGWGTAMTAELAQVQDRPSRWRFALGGARAAVFPPRGSHAAVGLAGMLAVAAVVATALVTGAAVPAGRVFALTFVALLGGLVTLTVARSGRVGRAWAGPATAGLALAGVAGCIAATTYYLLEHPTYEFGYPPVVRVSLAPVTAVVLAVGLAGCLWVALAPPRWLRAGRHARRFGIGMAIALAACLVPASRGGGGVMDYLFVGAVLVVLAGSLAAAAVGRSFRAGVGACVWALALGAPLLVAVWLVEALRVYERGGGLLLDGDGGGVGSNLGDAVWWSLMVLLLWVLPLGVIGAAVGSALARRGRPVPSR